MVSNRYKGYVEDSRGVVEVICVYGVCTVLLIRDCVEVGTNRGTGWEWFKGVNSEES